MNQDNIQKLVLIRPVNEPDTATSTYAPRVADLHGKRVGLLDNSKHNANKMLDAVAAILDQQYGFSNIVRHRKPSASKPVAPEVIESLGEACDVVIVGVGDWGSCSSCSVHDGIHLDRAGIPAATICTDHFVNTSQATATVWGVPAYPVIYMPHPLSKLSDEGIQSQAQSLAGQIVRVLQTGG